MNYIATLRDQVQSMATGFVAALPHIAIGLIVLLVTWIVARFAAKIADMLVG
ncbi:MAG: mechanosensitive ion channel family protein, partial [Alphaproteobacteria bacterium]|nr:mechanosensitive ion channel family protein [Alphaproteobacteria bacterium]